MLHHNRLHLIWLLLALLLVACSPETLLDPPRAATQTAMAVRAAAADPGVASTTPATAAIGIASAATGVPTPELQQPTVAVVEPLTVWVGETSDAHRAALAQIAAGFTAESGVPVAIIALPAADIAGLARTALLTRQLPDLIIHRMEQTPTLLADGILDPAAATAVADALGRDSFAPGAFDLIPPTDGLIPALPSDGWQHLVIYRRDWFEQAGLAAPANFDALMRGAQTFFNADALYSGETVPDAIDLVTGIVLPTDSDLPDTQQVFEHFASANGCRLADSAGTVTLLHPACLETLDFYRELVFNYSPIGFQTDISAIKAYLAGRTAIIVTTPSVLPMLAGVRADYLPNCPACAEDNAWLVRNSGILTELTGYGQYGRPANFAEITYVGITTAAAAANVDAAQAFARYWFEDGYLTWLAVEPERKVPLRVGAAETQPTLAAWRALPVTGSDRSLDALFGSAGGPAVSDLLVNGLTTPERWGFAEGQGRLTGAIYLDDLTIAPILQRMLSGYISSAQAIIDANAAVVTLAGGSVPVAPPAPGATPAP